MLYIRDVPMLWLPFIFQDMRPGRRSGILVPQFGINDLIRPSGGYNRQVTNIGYYWAPNDYLDLTARLDWFANRYLQYGVTGSYRWLDRFMSGTAEVNQQREVDGSTGFAVRWDHRQTFDMATSLNLSFNYASNTTVLKDNAIDPLQNTQQITSSLNFSKRYGWGTLTLGGSRRQDLSNGNVQQLLPAVTLSPVPIAIGSNITWSPGLSFTNNTNTDVPAGTLLQVSAAGGLDTIALTSDTRVTAFNFDTPLRFGSFNWSNSLQVTDQNTTGRESVDVPGGRPEHARSDRFRHGEPDFHWKLPERARLGYRHQPARALSRLVEAAADVWASRTRRRASRSRSATGTPTATGSSRESGSASVRARRPPCSASSPASGPSAGSGTASRR